MTYAQLAEKLKELTPEQLQQDVTILLLTEKEAIPVIDFMGKWVERAELDEVNDAEWEAFGCDVADGCLDQDHPYLTIDR